MSKTPTAKPYPQQGRQTAFRLPQDVDDELWAVSRREGVSMRVIVILALRAYFAAAQQEKKTE